MEPITIATVIAFITITGAGAKLWHGLALRSEKAREDAAKVKDDLQNYKLLVSETYVAKEDLRLTLQPLVDNINGIKGSIDKLSDRFDRILEESARRPAGRSRSERTE